MPTATKTGKKMSGIGMVDSKVDQDIFSKTEQDTVRIIGLSRNTLAGELVALRIMARNVVYSAQNCDKNFVYVKREQFEKLKEFFE